MIVLDLRLLQSQVAAYIYVNDDTDRLRPVAYVM